MFGEPKALSVCLRNVPPMPCENSATASGPYSALIAFIFSATTSSASSHVTAVHSSWPRFCRRTSGVREPVGVEVRADAARAARAEAAAAERVVGVALDLPELPVPDVGDRAALPEADVAEGGHLPDAALEPGGAGRVTGQTSGRRARRRKTDGRAGNLQEPPPGNRVHAG